MLAKRLVPFLVFYSVLLSACNDATGPCVEPEIRNIADSFEFQVSELNRYSRTLTYTWSNIGVVANVNQSAALTGGTAQLIILDRTGAQVYSRSLTENGTFVTGQGQTGNWQLRVVLNEASGTSP